MGELNATGFITYREWGNHSWFAKHPSLAEIYEDKDDENLPITLMAGQDPCGGCGDQMEAMGKLHPALEDITLILNWLFDSDSEIEEFPPKRANTIPVTKKAISKKSTTKKSTKASKTSTTTKTSRAMKNHTTKKSITTKKMLQKRVDSRCFAFMMLLSIHTFRCYACFRKAQSPCAPARTCRMSLVSVRFGTIY